MKPEPTGTWNCGQTIVLRALLERRVLAVGVAVVREVVARCSSRPGWRSTSSSPAACPGGRRRTSRRRCPRCCGGSVELCGPGAVARRARVAEHVVVRVDVADLDAVALAVALGAGARVDAGVAVAVRLDVLVEAVVGGEGEHAVVLAVRGDELAQAEAVGLDDVDVVERALLDPHVAQEEAVGAVGADDVLLEPVALDQRRPWGGGPCPRSGGCTSGRTRGRGRRASRRRPRSGCASSGT